MIEFFTKTFSELTTDELYELLQVRSEVFVIEQECVYQDIDSKDKNALHVLGILNHEIVAYARIFDKGHYFEEASIGRVVVKKEHRKDTYGHLLMAYAIEAVEKYFEQQPIKISAQAHLEKFYNTHGFVTKGASYLEDGIPHLAMYRD
ncbi:GNAT family N-acetyltransferase [Flavicella sediminum]|uniref:GNAT family N-acetyltransferase n=1 Tax=Flavicella sediminum TaxID=2585141 RepID=UPI002939331B|nr:GNAT family N-acetyltransferase [Flavicella sediminum]